MRKLLSFVNQRCNFCHSLHPFGLGLTKQYSCGCQVNDCGCVGTVIC